MSDNRPSFNDQMKNMQLQGQANRSCFPGDTLIRTPSGEKNISSLHRGDAILSVDVSSGDMSVQYIKRIKTSPQASIWRIEFASQLPVRSTKYHSFLTQRGWVSLRNLLSDDVLFSINDNGVRGKLRIKSVAKTSDMETVYNLVTTGKHNFIASGIIAHNFTFMRTARTLFHRLLERDFTIPFISDASQLGEALRRMG